MLHAVTVTINVPVYPQIQIGMKVAAGQSQSRRSSSVSSPPGGPAATGLVGSGSDPRAVLDFCLANHPPLFFERVFDEGRRIAKQGAQNSTQFSGSATRSARSRRRGGANASTQLRHRRSVR